MKTNKFPLYINDGICIEQQTPLRRKTIESFKKAVQNNELFNKG